MVNINKVIARIEEKGLKKGKFCTDALGVPRQYLDELARGKRNVNNVPEEMIFQMAEALGTSFEYLTDLTDDPAPDFLLRTAGTLQDKLQNEIIARYNTMTEDQRELLNLIIKMDPNEAKKALAVLRAIKGE